MLNAATEYWWLKLNDPLLAHYVEQGNNQNLSVSAALERIREAEATLGTVGLNAQTDGDLAVNAQRSPSGSGPEDTLTGRFNAAYILDVFGGVRRGKQQAVAGFEAAQFDAGVVRLAFLSDITEAYLQARYFQTAAAITRSTIDGRRQLLGLVQELRRAGSGTQLDVEQARRLLKSAEANLPSLMAGYESNVFRLATLLSQPAEAVLHEMNQSQKQPHPVGFTGAGVPANLLRNRPDIRKAEREYAASVAAVGVAEARLYPSLTLSGSITATESSVSGFSGLDNGWAFGPSLNIPVLNRGVLTAQRRVAESEARQAELAYRSTVQGAVEEVQRALSQCLYLRRQVSALQETLVYSRRVLELSQSVFRAQEISLTEVIDAEISLAQDRLSLAAAQRDYALAWAQLQVSAGKGWAAPALQSELENRNAEIRRDPLGLSALFKPRDS